MVVVVIVIVWVGCCWVSEIILFPYGHCGAILADTADYEYLTEVDEQPQESQPEHGANGQTPHAIEERNLKEGTWFVVCHFVVVET